MAIVRCDKCGLNFRRTKRAYHDTPVKPIGFPNTAAICGITGCSNAGMVWLEKHEHDAYLRGERYFGVKTNSVKVKVESREN